MKYLPVYGLPIFQLETALVLSVIVLAYNNMEFTRRCLESIKHSELPPNCEILLVDNASTDQTPSLAAEFSSQFRKFVYMRNDVNQLCSVAFNKAASIAGGDYLLFLNNDIVVGPRSMETLLHSLMDDTLIGMAGGKLFYPERKYIQHAGIVPMLWGYPVNDGSGAAAEDPRFNNEGEMFAVTGAMCLVRKTAFEAARGFEEGFRWGLEDVDLCLKIRTAGYRILYIPAAEAIHFESLTVNRDKARTLANYQLYRQRWDSLLIPREEMFIDRLTRNGVRRAIIFGTGQAGQSILKILRNSSISVVGFVTSSESERSVDPLSGKTVYGLNSLADVHADAIIVGSQYYYSIEGLIPKSAIYPKV